MTKLIALVAAGAFAAGTMFAGEHGDCTKKAGNEGKMACTASLATLNLTADQKDEDGNGDGRTPQSGVYGSEPRPSS